MRINGAWELGDDGIVRPVIRGEVLTSRGLWMRVPFLVDTGADQTVFSAAILTALSLQSRAAQDRIGGVGGIVNSVLVETQIRFYRETGSPSYSVVSIGRLLKLRLWTSVCWDGTSWDYSR